MSRGCALATVEIFGGSAWNPVLGRIGLSTAPATRARGLDAASIILSQAVDHSDRRRVHRAEGYRGGHGRPPYCPRRRHPARTMGCRCGARTTAPVSCRGAHACGLRTRRLRHRRGECPPAHLHDESRRVLRVGESERQAGVFYASACSGHGFKFAPGIGNALASMALRQAPAVDVAHFLATRLGRGEPAAIGARHSTAG
jgi:hypothetical protein